MNRAHFSVMPRNAHQPVTGLARPAYRIHPFQHLAALRIKQFVGRALGIALIRVDDVPVAVVRQPHGGIGDVADGENHGIHIQISGVLRGFAGDVAVALGENVFRHRQPVNSSTGIAVNSLGRAEEAEAQSRLALRMLRCRRSQHRESLLRELADVLPHGGKLRLDAAELFVEGLAVKKFFNVVKLFFVELGFKRPAPRDHHDLLCRFLWRVDQQPARNVHHHVAHAHNRHAPARGKIVRGKRRQEIIAVNKILGSVDAPDRLSRKPQFLGSLRADGKNNG